MEFLLRFGADVEQANKKGLKFNLNVSDNEGRFPLWHACFNGNHDLINFLIMAGANVEQSDNDGLRPIHIVPDRGHYEAVKLLLEVGKADLHSTDKEGSSILWHASCGGHIGIMNLLIENNVNKGNRKGSTPLHIAVKLGKIEAVKLLLRNGALVNQIDKWGCSALWHAADNIHTDIMKLLLESGANVNQVGRYSQTPLLAAVDSWNEEKADAVKLLLEAGANVEKSDFLGLKPLHIAAKEGRWDIVKMLIEVGKADPNSKRFLTLYFRHMTKSLAKWTTRVCTTALLTLHFDIRSIEIDLVLS